ncbi:SDR family oxidoreductase [Actinocatenispora comari]|uniref:SDR family oxidoreductase n=1 Tax=Actinocatenispora comari TaxID=2807577 RepID=UPI001A92A0A0|nr:SDR family oxidoreductase [Actinocatenispora comari]
MNGTASARGPPARPGEQHARGSVNGTASARGPPARPGEQHVAAATPVGVAERGSARNGSAAECGIRQEDMMILVTGAAGKAGSAVVRAFARRGAPVRAVVRDPARVPWLAELPGVTVVAGDLRRAATLGPALEGVKRALLISSPREEMVDTQLSFIDAAQAAGVPHIVKYSGREAGVGFDQEVFRGTRWHGQIERYLERSGLAWTHLRPSQFMQNYLPSSVTGFDVTTRELVMPLGAGQLSPVDLADVAEIAVGVLTTDGHENKAYDITGPEALTMAEVADRVSAATGATFRYVEVTFEEQRRRYAAAGLPPHVVDLFDEQFRERHRTPIARVELAAHRTFGVTPTHFAQFASAHAEEFTGSAR